jgi:DNA ligase-1
MKRFAALCEVLETTSRTREKRNALIAYFQQTPPEDAIWAIYLLTGHLLSRVVTSKVLHIWAQEVSDIPAWLFEESRAAVGDLAETVALLLPVPEQPVEEPLHTVIQDRLLPLKQKDEAIVKSEVIAAWRQMDALQRFVWNKLLTGSFRPHVSEKALVKALSAWRGLPETILACRLKDDWEPTVAAYRKLFSHDTQSFDSSQPYPFHVIGLLKNGPETLGAVDAWHAEWHWKGIRVQVVKREGCVFIWSAEHVLLSDKFPELCEKVIQFPDGTVIDGVIVAWNNDTPMNAIELERRVKRKRVTKSLVQDIPVRYLAFDLLEKQGQDIRACDFSWRHERLRRLLADQADSLIQMSTGILTSSWEELNTLRNEVRKNHADGLLLRRLDSLYCSDQQRGQWQLWKADPLRIKAVLLYVQRLQTSPGRRGLECSFGLWGRGSLVPVTKTSSGLSEGDIQELETFVKEHTLERFGPVRSVTPELVFEIAFDDVHSSSRHKSGVTLEHPRIVSWRRGASAKHADTLETIQSYIR